MRSQIGYTASDNGQIFRSLQSVLELQYRLLTFLIAESTVKTQLKTLAAGLHAHLEPGNIIDIALITKIGKRLKY